jgi:hypothetical protein
MEKQVKQRQPLSKKKMVVQMCFAMEQAEDCKLLSWLSWECTQLLLQIPVWNVSLMQQVGSKCA